MPNTSISQPSGLCPRLPGWAGTRTNLDFTEARDSEWQWHQQGHMQIWTKPAPHHSVFYRPDDPPAAKPTASKHWRQPTQTTNKNLKNDCMKLTAHIILLCVWLCFLSNSQEIMTGKNISKMSALCQMGCTSMRQSINSLFTWARQLYAVNGTVMRPITACRHDTGIWLSWLSADGNSVTVWVSRRKRRQLWWLLYVDGWSLRWRCWLHHGRRRQWNVNFNIS